MRNLERGFIAIWDNYLKGNHPRHISVEDVGFEYYDDVDDSNNKVITRLVNRGFSHRFSSVDWNSDNSDEYEDEEYADDSYEEDDYEDYDDNYDGYDDDEDEVEEYDDGDEYDDYDDDDDEL